MDPDQEWERWRSWLGEEPKGQTIYAQLVEMQAFRQVWEGFAIILREAPNEARRFELFSTWVRWNYARTQGVSVRRIADRRSDVVSLARLIDRVWRYPTVMSRERYREHGQGHDFESAEMDRWFTQLAGSGDYIDPRIPARDFEDLQRRTAKVRTWVNRSVAHLREKGEPSPPLAEIHTSVDAIWDVFGRYMSLIMGMSVHRSVVLDPWPAVFRVAWIFDNDDWVRVMDKITKTERQLENPPQLPS